MPKKHATTSGHKTSDAPLMVPITPGEKTKAGLTIYPSVVEGADKISATIADVVDAEHDFKQEFGDPDLGMEKYTI